MIVAVIDVAFPGNQSVQLHCPITTNERRVLRAGPNGGLQFRLIKRTLDKERATRGSGFSAFDVTDWTLVGIKETLGPGIHIRERKAEDILVGNLTNLRIVDASTHQAETTGPGKRHRAALARSRSILRLGNRLLPAAIREETLEEWMDELECAADQNLSVLPRARSILFRSLPLIAWRSRRPERTRQGGG